LREQNESRDQTYIDTLAFLVQNGESDAALEKSPAMDQSVSCNEFGWDLVTLPTRPLSHVIPRRVWLTHGKLARARPQGHGDFDVATPSNAASGRCARG